MAQGFFGSGRHAPAQGHSVGILRFLQFGPGGCDHPLGLFKSHKSSPRVVITNGLMVGEGDNPEAWAKATAMGCSSYGQMTAGGWMYIGPQGIVHGTFNTILNAGRKFLGVPHDGDLAGHLFVTSGLGGMSGAQPKGH